MFWLFGNAEKEKKKPSPRPQSGTFAKGANGWWNSLPSYLSVVRDRSLLCAQHFSDALILSGIC